MSRFAPLWLVAALAVSACSRYAPVDSRVCVDPGLSPEKFQAALDAADSWRAASDGRVDLEVVASLDEDCDIDLRQKVLAKGAAKTNTHWDHDPRIRVDFDNTEPSDWWLSIAHEYGHALGASHSSDELDVMFPRPSGLQLRVTKADVSKVLQ